jgi:hypothetical protein
MVFGLTTPPRPQDMAKDHHSCAVSGVSWPKTITQITPNLNFQVLWCFMPSKQSELSYWNKIETTWHWMCLHLWWRFSSFSGKRLVLLTCHWLIQTSEGRLRIWETPFGLSNTPTRNIVVSYLNRMYIVPSYGGTTNIFGHSTDISVWLGTSFQAFYPCLCFWNWTVYTGCNLVFSKIIWVLLSTPSFHYIVREYLQIYYNFSIVLKLYLF